MIHVIVSRQIKLITENSQRELIVNILIKKKKKKLILQENYYHDNVWLVKIGLGGNVSNFPC